MGEWEHGEGLAGAELELSSLVGEGGTEERCSGSIWGNLAGVSGRRGSCWLDGLQGFLGGWEGGALNKHSLLQVRRRGQAAAQAGHPAGLPAQQVRGLDTLPAGAAKLLLVGALACKLV